MQPDRAKAPSVPVSLADIAAALGLPAPADAGRVITGIANVEDAAPGELTLVSTEHYLRLLPTTRAIAAVLPRKLTPPPGTHLTLFQVEDVDLAMVNVLKLFARPIPRPPVGSDPLSRVENGVLIPADARVGPYVCIGSGVSIGARAVFHAGVIIGDDVTIGDDCEIHSNVVIRERVTIGNRVIINAGSVIGTDGFGYRWDGKEHVKVPQIGTVIIEDDVELGSCVCIDRAKIGATIIGRGTKIDNLVQIAHNVKVGPLCIIAGQTGIAGSTTLGTGVVLGGAASVSDHLHIGDGVMAAGRTAIHADIPANTIVSGMPALPHRQSLREQAAFRKLPELLVQMRKFQEQFETMLSKAREMGFADDNQQA